MQPASGIYDLILKRETRSYGKIILQNADHETVRMAGDGQIRIGTNVDMDDGTALHYEPETNRLTIRALLQLENGINIAGPVELQQLTRSFLISLIQCAHKAAFVCRIA